MASFYKGTEGYVKIGAVSMPFKTWRTPLTQKLPNISNFTGAGFADFLNGVSTGKILIEGPYHTGAVPVALGGLYTWVLGISASVALSIAAIVESLEPDNDYEDAPRINIGCQATGPFTLTLL